MGLKQQIQHLMGKDRRSSLLTQIKNNGQIARFCDAVQEKYGLQNIHHLKMKHVMGVMEDLQAKGLGSSTLASYATAARQVASAIGKQNIVPRTNRELGISRAGDRLKPVEADVERIADVTAALYQKAEWLGLAAELRQYFGLRAKESLLSNEINLRDQLVVCGAKGGRPRSLTISTPEQRDLVERVQVYIQQSGQTSLIPTNMSLKQGLKFQSNALHRLGATKENRSHAHASRHRYAQDRCKEGASGEQISAELGHGRKDVVSHYSKK